MDCLGCFPGNCQFSGHASESIHNYRPPCMIYRENFQSSKFSSRKASFLFNCVYSWVLTRKYRPKNDRLFKIILQQLSPFSSDAPEFTHNDRPLSMTFAILSYNHPASHTPIPTSLSPIHKPTPSPPKSSRVSKPPLHQPPFPPFPTFPNL